MNADHPPPAPSRLHLQTATYSPALQAPRGWRALLGFRRMPPQWPVAVRTSLCVVTPAAAGLVAGDLASGLIAALGGFAGLFGGGLPYLHRAGLLTLIALGEAAAVGLGIAAGFDRWVAVVVVTGIAALATLLCNAFSVSPAAYQIVLVGATGTAMAGQDADPLRTTLLVLAGGLGAVVVHVVPGLFDRRSPERRLVAAAAEATADYVDAIGTSVADQARNEAAEQLYASWLALVNQQPLLRHPGGELLRLRELSRQTQLLLADAMRRERPDPTAAQQARRIARRARRRYGDRHDFVTVSLPLGHPGRLSVLRQQLRLGSRSLLVLGRVTLAAAVVGVLGNVFGLVHTYWAVAATVLVLSPGFDRLRTIQRGLQRTAGTVVGVGLAAALLATQPSGWVLVALLAVLTYCTQLLVPRNYALAAVSITASALLIAAGGRGASTDFGLLLARAGETAFGCALALGVFAVVANRTPRGWLPEALARTLETAADAVSELTPARVTSRAGMLARRELQAQAARLVDTFETGLNGFPAQRLTSERLWPAVVSVERLAYRVLAEGWRMQERNTFGGPLDPGIEPMPADGLRRLAAAIRQGRPAAALGEVPGFVSRDVADLRRVLGPLDISRLPAPATVTRPAGR